MAHFALTIDSDPTRRQEFIARASASLKSLPGLDVAQAEVGELAIVWAQGPTAPHSRHLGKTAFGLLLGYAIGDAGQWLDAGTVLKRWSNPSSQNEAFDGYHAAVAYSQSEGLALGVDVLGLFPMYYAAGGGVLIAGTSAELFAAHPRFETKLDLQGLVEIFLTNGLLDGRTLFRGARRLGCGCQLRWNAAQGAREIETFRLAPRGENHRPSAGEIRERADAGLVRAIRRHRPANAASALMLSGGLDSRLMAGYLRSEGITDAAVCLGRPADLEVEVGTRVAAACGLKVHREAREPDAGRFLDSARRAARWEHLAGGFSDLESEGSAETVGRAAPMFWSGFALEDVLSADTSWFGNNPGSGGCSFELFFGRLNGWGLPPEDLKSLLRAAEAGELIQEQIRRFRRGYERADETPPQRAFRMKLATRVRFHVGVILHRMSFKSWPLLPVLDRCLLNVMFNAPIEMLLARRLEKDLLLHRFPRLAGIPREHNTFWLEPLRSHGPWGMALFQRTAARLEKKARRWYWQRWKKDEPRRYYRLYDFSGPLWRAVRAEAEAYRDRLDEWLDRKMVNDLLPPADVELKLDNPFSGAAVHRLLLGLLLWSARQNGHAAHPASKGTAISSSGH